jgi:beta-N-acetylhexosaminidase
MSPAAFRREIGQLLIAGFDGTQIPVETKALAREFGLGGVILFARNVVEPEQVADLCRDAARLTPSMPAWVSVDQEGGRVARLKAPFTEWPPMATLGRSGDESLAERFGRALAAELLAVGVSLDYAPVLDVNTNPRNPVIGDRALADHADGVARLGSAIVRAMQSEGLAACGKHFPGHGDTIADSHHELPRVEHSPERLREVELAPFRAAIAVGVSALMTAHVLVPSIDEDRPATLSTRILSGVLREELGFGGVILSDDLDMEAIAGRYDLPVAAVLAVEAGCDGVLVCGPDQSRHAAALEALIHAVEERRLPFARIESALKRHQRAKERFLAARVGAPLGAKAIRGILGRDEHQAIAREMARFA